MAPVAGRASSDLLIPEGLSPDPSAVGWPIAHEWKRPESYLRPPLWLAIMAGRDLSRRTHLECLVLSMVSTFAYFDECGAMRLHLRYCAGSRSRSAASAWSNLATIARFRHDLVLSDEPVREAVRHDARLAR